jgi:hypothetical protein
MPNFTTNTSSGIAAHTYMSLREQCRQLAVLSSELESVFKDEGVESANFIRVARKFRQEMESARNLALAIPVPL